MNKRLKLLQPYPFERMNALKGSTQGNPDYPHIALSIGEPKHPAAPFLVDILTDASAVAADLGIYPATRGSDQLRTAIAEWIQQRFGAIVDPATSILPVAGTREALFSFGQAVFSQAATDAVGILPNPFYQIYEGAVLLSGAQPHFVNTSRANDFLPEYRSIPEQVWRRCELLYLCSPGNPTGRTLPASELAWLIEQADRYDFIIAADECYSEIYFDEQQPPVGLLQVAADLGRSDFSRCVVFHSLSKRSNLPGLRSGFVAGDAAVLEPYFQYRTYEGCALGQHIQRTSAAAWADEQHVRSNRAAYRKKFDALGPLLETAFDFVPPDGAFYHWLDVGGDDQVFTLELFREQHITVLPGSFLSRSAGGENPGTGFVRVAWVAPFEQCCSAAQRLVDWTLERRSHA